MLQGDLTSLDGIKKGLETEAKKTVSKEVNKQADKLFNNLDLADEDKAELKQTADDLFRGLFDNKK